MESGCYAALLAFKKGIYRVQSGSWWLGRKSFVVIVAYPNCSKVSPVIAYILSMLKREANLLCAFLSWQLSDPGNVYALIVPWMIENHLAR